MPIPFKCPTCGAVGHVPSSAAGLHIGCPKCKALLEVPKQAGVGDVPRSAPYSSPPPVRKPPGASRAADQPAEPTHAACPYCGEQILAHAKKCKHCGEILDAELRDSRQGKRPTPASRYDDDDEPDYYSPARQRQSGADPFGVISLIFGSLAVVCMLMGCFTCGITYFAAAPFAAVGAGLAFFGRGNMKVAALVLNLVALVPAVVVFVMLITGSMLSANRELWRSNAPTQSAPRLPGRR